MLRLALAVTALLTLTGLAPARADDEKVLNVYNWTDYIDPAAIERFTKETGITVHYDVYDSLETLEAKMLTGHSGYDIIVPTAEPTLSRLIRSGALMPIDKSKIPSLAGLDPALMKRVATSDPDNKYAAIYLWGTIGLGEIQSKLKNLVPDADLNSWDLFFKAELAKKVAPCGITMLDSATDVIPTALRYLHRDPNSTGEKDLADVAKLLSGIRPYIRTFAAGGALEALASGDTCLVFGYSGDVIQAQARAAEAKRAPVTYVAPHEFTQLWFDTLAIPKDAPHADNAMKFINFILQPENIAGVTNVVHYPNAVPGSKDKVTPAIRDDHDVYPTQADLSNSFTVSAVSEAAVRARTRIWARFKAGN